MTKRRVQTTEEAGRKGGKAYAANHTPAERSERAKRAVKARWRKRREGVPVPK